MIDIESKIFDTLYTAITTAHTTAKVYGEYISLSNEFPLVTIIESNNTVLANTQDCDSGERHASLSYEINVFTNDSAKKSTAKAIAHTIDTTMRSLNFTRVFYDNVPNEDRTIYRMVLRYNGIVGEGVTSGTDTSYRIYRR